MHFSWKSVFPILRNLPTATNKKFSHDLKMIKSTVGTVINAREKLMQEADGKYPFEYIFFKLFATLFRNEGFRWLP